MIAAMDEVGNPSSVHQEGRAAKMIMERAREQVAVAMGAQAADIVFTSGATEAAALCLAGAEVHCSHIEHEAVSANCIVDQAVDDTGKVDVTAQSTAHYSLRIPKRASFRICQRGYLHRI